MKKRFVLGLAFFLTLIGVYAQSNALPRLAVVEFSTNINTNQIKSDAVAVRNLVENEMVAVRMYQIITRDEIDKLLVNQRIQVSSIASSENVKKLQLENISYIVTGSVDSMDNDYWITVKVLNISTGLFSHSERGVMGRSSRDLSSGLMALMKIFTAGMAAVGGQVVQTDRSAWCKVEYNVHASGIGWMGTASDGETAGTTGQNRQLEAIRVKVSSDITGGIQYMVHAANIGWMSWVSNYAQAGTTGQSRRIEAISVQLTGDLSKQYDVLYRVHQSNIGWHNWAWNGDTSGITGRGLQIEAIEIKVQRKQ